MLLRPGGRVYHYRHTISSMQVNSRLLVLLASNQDPQCFQILMRRIMKLGVEWSRCGTS